MAVIHGYEKVVVAKTSSWLDNLLGTPKGNLIEDILHQEFTFEALRFFKLYAVSIENGQACAG